MVRFEKDKLVIEIETKFPEDDLRELQRDLLRLICAADKDRIDNDNDCICGVCGFLEELLAGSPCSERHVGIQPTCGAGATRCERAQAPQGRPAPN